MERPEGMVNSKDAGKPAERDDTEDRTARDTGARSQGGHAMRMCYGLWCCTRAAVAVFLLATFSAAAGPLPIIPGAHGFGMETPAGSGRHLDVPKTTVIKVTNLNDAGPGSLRDALENQPGPKTIVFEVSGNIALRKEVLVGGFVGRDADTKGSYITIAGQTAPSPGITLKDYGIKVERSCHDILIHHIRIRPGDTPILHGPTRKSDGSNPLGLESNRGKISHDIVVDHCSFSWGGGMNIHTRGSRLTIRNCIIAECLHSPLHPKGRHSRGLLVFAYGPTEAQDVCIIGNLFAQNMARNPTANGFARAVIANNAVYDANVGIKYDCNGRGKMCVASMRNVIKRVKHPLLARAMSAETRFYFGPDNMIDGKTFGSVSDVWEKVYMPFAPGVAEVCRANAPPIRVPGLKLRPVGEVEEWVLANAGARPADRDPVGKRIISNVKNGKGKIIASQKDVGGWPKLEENRRELTVPDNPSADDDGDGYTNLEEWLHAFAAGVEATAENRPR